jgi:hypothetical protein
MTSRGILWERSKTPLERMYDRWVGEGNWEPARPRTSYIVYSHSDIVWRDIPSWLTSHFPVICAALLTAGRLKGMKPPVWPASLFANMNRLAWGGLACGKYQRCRFI